MLMASSLQITGKFKGLLKLTYLQKLKITEQALEAGLKNPLNLEIVCQNIYGGKGTTCAMQLLENWICIIQP